MQIKSNKLEITRIFDGKNLTSEEQADSIRKHQELIQIDIFNMKKTKNDIITFLGNQILSADSLPQMTLIITEFAHYMTHITSQAFGNQQLLILNSVMIKNQTLNWFNEAHLSVYGSPIPNLAQHIRNEQKKIIMKR